MNKFRTCTFFIVLGVTFIHHRPRSYITSPSNDSNECVENVVVNEYSEAQMGENIDPT